MTCAPRRPLSRREINHALVLLVLACILGGPLAGTVASAPARSSEAAGITVPAAARAESAEPAQDEPEPMIFSEDFEAYGDSSRWSHDFPFPVQRDTVASGTHAARITSTGGLPMYGQRRLNQGYTRLFVRVDFQIIERGSTPVTIFHLRPGRAQSVIAVKIEPSGRLSYLTGATGIRSESSVTVNPGAWHRLQVFVDTTIEQDNVRIWLDEAELTTMRQDVWFNNDAVNMIEIGDNTTGVTIDMAIDDILVDDAFIPADRGADPVPGTLRVRAIPAWEGIRFELDGEIFTTGADGTVQIPVKRWSTDLRRRIIVHDATNEQSKIAFTGWREWLSPRSRDVYATFALWQPISVTFTDMYGVPVDVSLIDSVIIKSNTGVLYTLNSEDLQDPVLLVSRVVTTPTGVNVKPVVYIVDAVNIGGANVVNRAQQRTDFGETTEWTISLLMYQVKFQAIDALFGDPVGREIAIESPDGTIQQLKVDENGAVFIPRIPRGDYIVSVIGGGYSPPRPIRISRDQIVQLEVISHLDAMLAIGTASFVAIGLVIAGRPHLVTRPIARLGAMRPGFGRIYERRAGP